MRDHIRTFGSYVVSGGIAALVNLGFLYLLTDIAGMWYLAASTFSYAVSLIINFSLQKYWAFREISAGAIPRQFVQFVLLGLANISLNALFMYVLVSFVSVWHMIAQIIVIAVLAALNFFVYKKYVFTQEVSVSRTAGLTAIFLLILWSGLHIPGIMYGTQTVPLHQSYIGDEQSPVNGALHVLNDKSLLAFRDKGVVYYGPVFPMFAIPPVVADFSIKYATGVVSSALEYRNYILYDWGGIVFWIHFEAMLLSLVSLVAFWTIVRRKSVTVWMPLIATGFLAFNYYFFEYSHFFKHWAVVIPALLVQFSTMLAIQENPHKARNWIFHAIAALVAAGVSYISLLFMVMWLPTLYAWIKQRDTIALRRFFVFSVVIILGFALIIWWYPHAFVRLLGFIGIGDPTGGLEGTQNPLAGGATSFGYYGTLLFLNHIPIIFAALIMGFAVGARKTLTDPIIQAAVLVAMINFLLFASAEHHEGRYMLPTIVFLLLALGRLLVLYVSSAPKSQYAKLTSIFLALGLLFHVTSISGWIHQYSQGPGEEFILKELLRMPEPILMIDSYILGVPHTSKAYQEYAEATGKTEVNLYKALLATNPPAGVEVRDIYYRSFDEVKGNLKLLREFPTIIQRFDPRAGELNQFDFIDENITRIWYADDVLPLYRIW